MKRILTLLALFAGLSAFGQEAQGNIPAEVFYMLPEFGQGMVYFSDQGPAQGEMNICAVDQTLRFLDEKGTELALDNDKDLLQVNFGDVMFLPSFVTTSCFSSPALKSTCSASAMAFLR